MWKYNKTDDIYTGRFDRNDKYIEHGRTFKYIRKYMGKNGKWIYVYQKVKKANSTNKIYQKTVKSKSGNTQVTVGNSKNSKYASVDLGKPKKDWTYDDYKEKKVKVGKTTFTANNETGTLNLRVDIDNNKKKRAASGKSIISKLFKK